MIWRLLLPMNFRNSAFTRGAVIAWVVIIGVLLILGFYVPSPPPAVVLSMQQHSAVARARMIGGALKMYANDHDGHYPVWSNENDGKMLIFEIVTLLFSELIKGCWSTLCFPFSFTRTVTLPSSGMYRSPVEL